MLEHAIIQRVMARFLQFGYNPVRPTIMELAEGTHAGAFTSTDPATGKLLALRHDITPHITRLVQERFADADRPLRLCYSGMVFKPESSDKYKERQQYQLGLEHVAEMQGRNTALVLSVAVQAVKDAGVEEMVIELTNPAAVKAAIGGDAEIQQAVTQKQADLLSRYPALRTLPEAFAQDAIVQEVTETIERRFAISCTSDALDSEGAEYYEGLAFFLLHPHTQERLGQGGIYRLPNGEQACGFTLHASALARASQLQVSATEEVISADTAWDDILLKHAHDVVTLVE